MRIKVFVLVLIFVLSLSLSLKVTDMKNLPNSVSYTMMEDGFPRGAMKLLE